MRKILLLSIKPEFADKIFNGEKTIELRKKRPKIEKGDIVLIYASSPRMTLMGGALVHEIITDSPCDLWESFSAYAGISEEKYNTYYENHNTAYGIVFSKVWEYKKPLTLKKIKDLWRGFVPPQSFRYLSYDSNIKLAWI